MNRLTQLALGKRSVTLLLTAALFVAGIITWGGLKQELVPDVSFPIVTVIAPYPGAGAADVTEQVTKPLEQAVSSIAGIDQIQSTSANSFGLVVAQFDYGVNLDDAVTTIEGNLRRAGLPAGVEPSVQAFNFNAAPVLISSLAAKGSATLGQVAEIARTELLPALRAIPGVATADLAGGEEEQLLITLDPAKLAAANVSLAQISGILQANNITIPGGELPVDGSRVPVSTIGRFESIEAIKGLVVGAKPAAVEGGFPTPITLADLGSVELAAVATTGYGRTNGLDAITVSISKTSSANAVTVSREAQAAIDAVAARHPADLQVVQVYDTSTFIVESTDGLLREGGLGALFAVLTIFLFLFNLRSTAIAAVSIPLSILTALVIMGAAGITLNILTLGGLAVAVGRVVDDSIVVLENIYRHRAIGEDRLTAVIAGPREVAGAITASTVTTVAVFLPLGFAGGFVSAFFLAFSLTVTFALVASLLVALTVVPVLAFLLLGRVKGAVDETGEPKNSFWVHLYDPLIRFVLRNGWTKLGTIVAAALLFVGSTAIVPSLPTAFINTGSEKILQVSVAPPAGATSQQVLDRAAQAEAVLAADPDVTLFATSVPSDTDVGFSTVLAAQAGRATNSATIFVRLKSETDLTTKTKALAEQLRSIATDGYDVEVGLQGGVSSNGLQVIVSADDATVVAETTQTVLDALKAEPGLGNLATDLVKAAPEIQVRVDPTRALGVGMTAAQVGGEIRSALVPTTVGLVTLGDARPVPLVVRLDPSALGSLDALKALPVGTTQRVPLSTIASVQQADVQGRITRIDSSPSATITAEITSGNTGATSTDVESLIQRLRDGGQIPASADVRLAGVTAQQREAFGGLFAAMGIAMLLVYLAMVLAFNSLVTPFIIMFSLPLATIGAFPALLITGRPIGLSALIGFLMLIGIVVTNAIVLLDLVERLKADGHSTRDALIEGGKTRIRPILMTAIATMLALVPLAAGFNQGSIIAAELGTVVIGGLLSSTFLTLLVIPAIYALLDTVKSRLSRLRRGSPSPA